MDAVDIVVLWGRGLYKNSVRGIKIYRKELESVESRAGDDGREGMGVFDFIYGFKY